ncbi:hypothetical protein KY349_01845 [Candidatus Woesearchaeota archaeon]|jgi:hypothetical protein|nr:hypothetical protein [Candidatus Woesearchaeota archaeon]
MKGETPVARFLYNVYGYRNAADSREETEEGANPEGIFKDTVIGTCVDLGVDDIGSMGSWLKQPIVPRIRRQKQRVRTSFEMTGDRLEHHIVSQAYFRQESPEEVKDFMEQRVVPLFPEARLTAESEGEDNWIYRIETDDFCMYVINHEMTKTRATVVDFNAPKELVDKLMQIAHEYSELKKPLSRRRKSGAKADDIDIKF